MQLIRAVPVNAEQYVAENYQRQIRPPRKCPHCGAVKTLWALCYYQRYVSRLKTSSTLQMWVRRFECCKCGGTVSILPSFAQPYRFVQNETVERFFRGPPYSTDVSRWLTPLRRYWKKFLIWIPEIDSVLGSTLGLSPPHAAGNEWRAVIAAAHGEVNVCTERLVSLFRITLFGRYRCHQPKSLESHEAEQG